jgi:hypothetical protein
MVSKALDLMLLRGRNTVAYIGRMVGFNEAAGKWEVQS